MARVTIEGMRQLPAATRDARYAWLEGPGSAVAFMARSARLTCNRVGRNYKNDVPYPARLAQRSLAGLLRGFSKRSCGAARITSGATAA